MNEFMQNYVKMAETEFDVSKKSIAELKDEFKSTDWLDIKSMILAANKI